MSEEDSQSHNQSRLRQSRVSTSKYHHPHMYCTILLIYRYIPLYFYVKMNRNLGHTCTLTPTCLFMHIQVAFLESVFLQTSKPTNQQYASLSAAMNCPIHNLRVFFQVSFFRSHYSLLMIIILRTSLCKQNRRAKERNNGQRPRSKSQMPKGKRQSASSQRNLAAPPPPAVLLMAQSVLATPPAVPHPISLSTSTAYKGGGGHGTLHDSSMEAPENSQDDVVVQQQHRRSVTTTTTTQDPSNNSSKWLLRHAPESSPKAPDLPAVRLVT